MQIYLIRHGKTEGNLKKRYIGTTDEPLCEIGRREIEEKHYDFFVERIYTSPLMRCRETARIIWPNQEFVVVNDLRECDFGLFENKNYQELSEYPQYQEWLDSMGTLPFPQGESRELFSERCINSFDTIIKECTKAGIQRLAMVVHGGTIMAIMERIAVPAGKYYDFQVENGNGFLLTSCEGGFKYDRIYEG